MEPLKPATKTGILRSRPDVTKEEIEEYERLLAERFTVDPQMVQTFEEGTEHAAREIRIRELYEKLFGGAQVSTPG